MANLFIVQHVHKWTGSQVGTKRGLWRGLEYMDCILDLIGIVFKICCSTKTLNAGSMSRGLA